MIKKFFYLLGLAFSSDDAPRIRDSKRSDKSLIVSMLSFGNISLQSGRYKTSGDLVALRKHIRAGFTS